MAGLDIRASATMAGRSGRGSPARSQSGITGHRTGLGRVERRDGFRCRELSTDWRCRCGGCWLAHGLGEVCNPRFRLGVHGGILTVFTPSLAKIASKMLVKLASRSRIRKAEGADPVAEGPPKVHARYTRGTYKAAWSVIATDQEVAMHAMTVIEDVQVILDGTDLAAPGPCRRSRREATGARPRAPRRRSGWSCRLLPGSPSLRSVDMGRGRHARSHIHPPGRRMNQIRAGTGLA
jgi:hypothetical protein